MLEANLGLGLGLLVLITVGLIVILLRHPGTTAGQGGRTVAFVAFLVLPTVLTYLGLSAHMSGAKSTEFCLSCHVMEPYGRSLSIDDSDYLPAVHFQNNLTPRDHACFTCHTTYTMFGDVEAKLTGLKHLWIFYSGQTPERIELYKPYNNRECLSCHGEARSFIEGDLHVDIMTELRSNETSCLDCHEFVHNVADLDDLELWHASEGGEP